MDVSLLFLLFCFVLFLNLILLRTPLRRKPSSYSHSIYVPQAQQNSLQSALDRAAKCIQQYVRVDQSATTQASRQEQVLPRATMYEDFNVSFFPPCCGSLNDAFIKPPTTSLDFPMYR